MVEVSVLGVALQEDGKTPVLLLFPHGSRHILSLRLGPMEAFAVSSALNEAEAPHPKESVPAPGLTDAPSTQNRVRAFDSDDLFFHPATHELLLRSLDALGTKISEVHIQSTSDHPLVGELFFDTAKRRGHTYCRLSDGIALAIRSGAPIRLSPLAMPLAEELEQTMHSLSSDMRTVVAAKLLTLPGSENFLPYLESVLASTMKRGPERAREPLPGIRHQIALEEENNTSLEKKQAIAPAVAAEPDADGEAHEIDAVIAPGQTIILPTPGNDRKAPTIRISLVRQSSGDGRTEGLDPFLFPASGISGEVLGTLSLSQEDVKAVGSADSEEERWSTLLRLLPPETKVPM